MSKKQNEKKEPGKWPVIWRALPKKIMIVRRYNIVYVMRTAEIKRFSFIMKGFPPFNVWRRMGVVRFFRFSSLYTILSRKSAATVYCIC